LKKEESPLVKDGKANKEDLEMCMRWVDLLHSMLKQIIQLYSMHLKSDLELSGHESQKLLQQRKS
jgi:hypothetical protein